MFRSIHDDLAQVLGAVEIHSSDSFSFAGSMPIRLSMLPGPVQLPGHPYHPLSDNPMVRAMQSVLYRRCYSHPFDQANGLAFDDAAAPDTGLIDRLAEANCSCETWDRGWRVYSAGYQGDVSLIKGDRQRVSKPGEYVIEDEPYRRVDVGARVSVRLVPESRSLQPGFYFMFGETPSDIWDEYHTVRYYINATPDTTVEMVRYLTFQLNRYQVPFQMKALTVPAWYSRSDSMVLYTARRDHGIISRIIGYCPREILNRLLPATPLFTKTLLSGVGLAEDPKTGESFGMHRCRLIAEAIVDAWFQGLQSVSARARAVIKRFSLNGLDIERPYLGNRWTVDLFETIRPAYEDQSSIPRNFWMSLTASAVGSAVMRSGQAIAATG